MDNETVLKAAPPDSNEATTAKVGVRGYVRRLREQLDKLRGLDDAKYNLVFLNRVFAHHAARSGYQQIADGLGPSAPLDCSLLPEWLLASLGFLLRDEHLARRVSVWASRMTSGADVLTIAYGDNDQWYLRSRLARFGGRRVLAVFHQPEVKLRRIFREIHPTALDGAICVSRCQIPVLEEFVGRSRVWFCPHGVDTEFFRPGEESRDPNLVLTIGQYRRDFETYLAVARTIKRRRPETALRLIAPRHRVPEAVLQENDWIEVLSNLSDQQLRENYRRAAVLFMPLHDATANNAILEGMACGTPLVATDVGGVGDYTGDAAALLCPHKDSAAHTEAVMRLLDNPQFGGELGARAHNHVQQLAWPLVRQKFLRIVAEGLEKIETL